MTKNEIINELESKGIIAVIGDNYLITEKYKSFNVETPLKKVDLIPDKLNLSELMNTASNGANWPIQLEGSQGFARGVNFCDVCEIPRFAAKGYPLRGMNKDTINILGNIMADEAICPSTFIDSVKTYYKYSEMPKGIKNLILEGTIFEIYKEHIEGKLIASLTGGASTKGNQTWS